MNRFMTMLVAASFILITLSTGVSGERSEGQKLVNIENYEHIRIDFQKGEALRVYARVEALSYPVSVMLIKGDAEFEKFRAIDHLEADEIRRGNITDMDLTYQVISGFSTQNTTLFDGSILIGDHDTYHLVMMLYRDSTMDPVEVLTSMATLVNYIVEWEVKSRYVPYYLIPVGVLSFLIGAGLLAYYFWPRGDKEVSDPRDRARDTRSRYARDPPDRRRVPRQPGV